VDWWIEYNRWLADKHRRVKAAAKEPTGNQEVLATVVDEGMKPTKKWNEEEMKPTSAECVIVRRRCGGPTAD